LSREGCQLFDGTAEKDHYTECFPQLMLLAELEIVLLEFQKVLEPDFRKERVLGYSQSRIQMTVPV
jgi:hypothetical protein